jgi:hypothetical protein
LTRTGFLAKFWETNNPDGGIRRMDVYAIEALLGLPEFRVVNQVIRPTRLDLHLERRDTSIV